jgi:hypothetical protein
VLEPDVEHVRDPSNRNAVQKEPPKSVDTVLDIAIPGASLVCKKEPELARKLARPRKKPSASPLLPETGCPISLDTSTREHRRKEATRTIGQDDIGVILKQIVPGHAVVKAGIAILAEGKASRETPVL